jgi:hypothetical protein
MFAFCLLGTTAALSVGIIVAVMRRAPEAYEGEGGLTIIHNGSHRAMQLHPAILGTNRSDTAKVGIRSSTQPQQKSFSSKANGFHAFPSLFPPQNRQLRSVSPFRHFRLISRET